MRLTNKYLTAVTATLVLSACNIEVQIDDDDQTDFKTYINFAEFKDVCGNFTPTDVPVTIFDEHGELFDSVVYSHDGNAGMVEVDLPGDDYSLQYLTGNDTKTYTNLHSQEQYTLTIRGPDATTCGCPSYTVTVNEPNIADTSELKFSTKFGSQNGVAGSNAGEWLYDVEVCADDNIIVSAPGIGMYKYIAAGSITADTSVSLDQQLQSIVPNLPNSNVDYVHIQTNYFDVNNGSFAQIAHANDAYHFVPEANYDLVQINYQLAAITHLEGINNNTQTLDYLQPTWTGNFQNVISTDIQPTSLTLIPTDASLTVEITDQHFKFSGSNLQVFDFLEIVALYNNASGEFSHADIVTIPMTDQIALTQLENFMAINQNISMLIFIPFDIAEVDNYTDAVKRSKIGRDNLYASEGTSDNGIMVAFEPPQAQ